jgi:hypothetical protein
MHEYVKDIKDATKKMSPHQDPRSERSAKMRHSLDNLPKSSKGLPKTSKKKSDHHPDKKEKYPKYGYGKNVKKIRQVKPMGAKKKK